MKTTQVDVLGLRSLTSCGGGAAAGRILLSQGKVEGGNINRSPSSYLENPAEERARYPDGNTARPGRFHRHFRIKIKDPTVW